MNNYVNNVMIIVYNVHKQNVKNVKQVIIYKIQIV